MTDEKEQKTEETKKDPITDDGSEAKPTSDGASETAEVEVPKEFKKIVEDIEKMSVLELNELVKVFEKRFGVSATAVAAAPQGGGGDAGAEEQTSFTIELTSVGDQKIAVIKVVKEVSGLGLKEAKDLVEGAPQVVKEGVKKDEAEELKKKFEAAGATVTLK